MNSAVKNVGDALAQKARGDEPGRFRAFVAAVAAGAVAATVTYKLLRSGGS
jgi:hypothetical protein